MVWRIGNFLGAAGSRRPDATLRRAGARLQAPFDSVAGLANGAEVRIGGVRKGTVYEIRMPTKPGEKMMVIMDLESSTHKVIKKDSVASIQTEGLWAINFWRFRLDLSKPNQFIRETPFKVNLLWISRI